MTASKVKYMIDAETLMRDSGQAAITATASTTGVVLNRGSGKEGHVDGLVSGKFVVNIDTGTRTTGGGVEETYVFTIEVADNAAFTTNKTTIGTLEVLPADVSGLRSFLFDDDDLEVAAGKPAFVRVTATLAGTSPSIVYHAFLAPVAND